MVVDGEYRNWVGERIARLEGLQEELSWVLGFRIGILEAKHKGLRATMDAAIWINLAGVVAILGLG